MYLVFSKKIGYSSLKVKRQPKVVRFKFTFEDSSIISQNTTKVR